MAASSNPGLTNAANFGKIPRFSAGDDPRRRQTAPGHPSVRDPKAQVFDSGL